MTTQRPSESLYHKIGRKVTKRLGLGVILILPLLVTFWLIKFAYDKMDGLLQPIISSIFGREVSGLSFAIIVVAVLLVGAFSSVAIFRWVGHRFEKGIIATPGVGPMYKTIKKLIPGSEQNEGQLGFNTVVRVEYPRRGAWAVGFLMSVMEDDAGTRYGIVYMPSTPMPQSGWLMQVPISDIQNVDWSSSIAMSYIVSAGVSCPNTIQVSPLEDIPENQPGGLTTETQS